MHVYEYKCIFVMQHHATTPVPLHTHLVYLYICGVIETLLQIEIKRYTVILCSCCSTPSSRHTGVAQCKYAIYSHVVASCPAMSRRYVM